MTGSGLYLRTGIPRIVLFLAAGFQFFYSYGEGNRFVLLIGDSHGAGPGGWAWHLQEKRDDLVFLNTAVAGNTFGFDNLDRVELNTLKNVRTYVHMARDSSTSGVIDDVVVLLGTNDCKAVFDSRQEEIPGNLSALIDSVRMLTASQEAPPVIYVVSPPPYGPDSTLAEKYRGAGARLKQLIPALMHAAWQKDCVFVDIYDPLLPDIERSTADGVHLKPEASRKIADIVSDYLDAYGVVEGDDTRALLRDVRMRAVDIVSSSDSTLQPAYFYATGSATKKPLVVRLHSWSGDYTQHDPLAKAIIDRDWNYIFPNFRGPNNTPEACGSPLAIQDIDDAIQYAIDQGRVDLENIHVVGSSGGGHATLLTYMKSVHPIRTFMAWVPISDLEAWYYESRGRGNKYAGHILRATGSTDESLDIDAMRSRSPYFMETPVELRAKTGLSIFAGIHDGYTGSVPVSQSIKMYNKLVNDFGGDTLSYGIDCNTTLDLVTMRSAKGADKAQLDGRAVLLYRQYRQVSLTIFEGSHEMLGKVVLDRIGVH